MVIKIIELFKWPIAVIIISKLFFQIFRKPIERFIDRIRKVSKTNIETEESQHQRIPEGPEIESNNDYEKLMQQFNSPSTISIEANIKNELEKKDFDDYKKINLLIHYLAAFQLELTYDRIYASIYGSQLVLIKLLNTKANEKKDNLEIYFDNSVKNIYPDFYRNINFEVYMNFLIGANSISCENDEYKITQFGIDFLVFLTQAGRSESLPY